MTNNKLMDFDSFDTFFEKRILPNFLIFSYLGLFLSIIYLPFDYSVYKDSSYLIGILISRFFAIFFALMVVLSTKINYFSNIRIIAITTFGTCGYTALTFGYIAYDAPSFFIIYNWFFYLVATMMLGALMTKRVFVIMETFQILIVILLMFYYGKNIDEIFLYFIVAISLVIYVYAVVRLNRENGEEAYNNACFMYITSSTDGLSGLLNRRTWYEKSEKIFKLTENISFIMLDIDHFKKINDTYGHDSGDIVIQHISNILLEQTRDDDIVGRLGGEEFGIILKNNEIEDILRIAQRIKDCVQNNIIIHNQNSINVTVSMGVVLKDKNISNFKDFIKKGDINLYKAKESGRNKIIFYQL